jgi:hypothetical protein
MKKIKMVSSSIPTKALRFFMPATIIDSYLTQNKDPNRRQIPPYSLSASVSKNDKHDESQTIFEKPAVPLVMRSSVVSKLVIDVVLLATNLTSWLTNVFLWLETKERNRCWITSSCYPQTATVELGCTEHKLKGKRERFETRVFKSAIYRW